MGYSSINHLLGAASRIFANSNADDGLAQAKKLGTTTINGKSLKISDDASTLHAQSKRDSDKVNRPILDKAQWIETKTLAIRNFIFMDIKANPLPMKLKARIADYLSDVVGEFSDKTKSEVNEKFKSPELTEHKKIVDDLIDELINSQAPMIKDKEVEAEALYEKIDEKISKKPLDNVFPKASAPSASMKTVIDDAENMISEQKPLAPILPNAPAPSPAVETVVDKAKIAPPKELSIFSKFKNKISKYLKFCTALLFFFVAGSKSYRAQWYAQKNIKIK